MACGLLTEPPSHTYAGKSPASAAVARPDSKGDGSNSSNTCCAYPLSLSDDAEQQRNRAGGRRLHLVLRCPACPACPACLTASATRDLLRRRGRAARGDALSLIKDPASDASEGSTGNAASWASHTRRLDSACPCTRPTRHTNKPAGPSAFSAASRTSASSLEPGLSVPKAKARYHHPGTSLALLCA